MFPHDFQIIVTVVIHGTNPFEHFKRSPGVFLLISINFCVISRLSHTSFVRFLEYYTVIKLSPNDPITERNPIQCTKMYVTFKTANSKVYMYMYDDI